jgi:drug/metabolite transporter (DMT)-like permease
LYGVGNVLTAAAYKFMIASMVIALKRFLSMIFGVLTGKLYFHEKHLIRKLTIASLLGIGVLIMNIEPLIAMYLGGAKNEISHTSAEVLPVEEKTV